MLEIDNIIPFSKRYEKETIREIIRSDSGYLKDLFFKDKRVIFSPQCLEELKRLTRGHKDNWERPKTPELSFLKKTKKYGVAYLYDFNNPKIEELNTNRFTEKQIKL